MPSTYIDCISYTKQPNGFVLTGYFGNMARISAALVGATSLTVPALAVALNQYDAVYVFDGPNSEILQVGAGGAALNATSIPLQAATQFAHAAGTPYCTDGTAGSLGEQIFMASQRIEDDICHQALWQTAYTNEVLTLPTMRAALDNQRNLHFRPRHFPITTLSGLSLRTNQQNAVGYDPTQAIIDSDQQTVDLPIWAALTSQGGGPPQTNVFAILPIRRETTAWLTLTYTAGFAVGALPESIKRAATLLVSDCFTPLENPVGADSITQGKRAITFVIRGDQTGESTLYKRAANLLQPYVMEGF